MHNGMKSLLKEHSHISSPVHIMQFPYVKKYQVQVTGGLVRADNILARSSPDWSNFNSTQKCLTFGWDLLKLITTKFYIYIRNARAIRN